MRMTMEERRARRVWAHGPAHSVANATAQAGIALIFDLRYRRATEPLASTEVDKRTSEPFDIRTGSVSSGQARGWIYKRPSSSTTHSGPALSSESVQYKLEDLHRGETSRMQVAESVDSTKIDKPRGPRQALCLPAEAAVSQNLRPPARKTADLFLPSCLGAPAHKTADLYQASCPSTVLRLTHRPCVCRMPDSMWSMFGRTERKSVLRA